MSLLLTRRRSAGSTWTRAACWPAALAVILITLGGWSGQQGPATAVAQQAETEGEAERDEPRQREAAEIVEKVREPRELDRQGREQDVRTYEADVKVEPARERENDAREIDRERRERSLRFRRDGTERDAAWRELFREWGEDNEVDDDRREDGREDDEGEQEERFFWFSQQRDRDFPGFGGGRFSDRDSMRGRPGEMIELLETIREDVRDLREEVEQLRQELRRGPGFAGRREFGDRPRFGPPDVPRERRGGFESERRGRDYTEEDYLRLRADFARQLQRVREEADEAVERARQASERERQAAEARERGMREDRRSPEARERATQGEWQSPEAREQARRRAERVRRGFMDEYGGGEATQEQRAAEQRRRAEQERRQAEERARALDRELNEANREEDEARGDRETPDEARVSPQLERLRAELAALRLTYGPAHPKIRLVEAQIAELRAK